MFCMLKEIILYNSKKGSSININRVGFINSRKERDIQTALVLQEALP